MSTFFCATASQQVEEDLIGTAGHFQTYVLIECPLPWAAKAFSSDCIPASLRQLVKSVSAQKSVRFLCMHRGLKQRPASTTVLIYECDGTRRYCGREFQLESLAEVADCLQSYWQGKLVGQPIASHVRDIAICTHGMRDKCCARFGQPFFREARALVGADGFADVRLWRVSHIGGHRFAPTAIAFPDGRYYGRLTPEIFRNILTRSGPISQVGKVYRGWGQLPEPLQVLERQLMLEYGWEWFDSHICYRFLAADAASSQPSPEQDSPLAVELSVRLPGMAERTYRATLVRAPENAYYLKMSCSADSPSEIVKYTVAECALVKPAVREALQPKASLV